MKGNKQIELKAQRYLYERAHLSGSCVVTTFDPFDLEQAFIDGANWQKEQLISNTADAMIGLPYENKDGGYTHLIDVSRPLPVGNNKIAIIFKEEQQ